MKPVGKFALVCAGLIAVLEVLCRIAGMAPRLAGHETGEKTGLKSGKCSYFSLTGFQYDNSISLSWSGVSAGFQGLEDNPDAVEVVVSPHYLLILGPGETYEEFEAPEDIVIPLDGKFHGTYESFFKDNPYRGRALLTLSVYPRYYDAATRNLYSGRPATIRFDSQGDIMTVELPDVSR